MALESAKFALEMIDGMSGPAKKGAKSLDQLQAEIRQTEKDLLHLSRVQRRADRLGLKGARDVAKQRKKDMKLRLSEMRMQARHSRQMRMSSGGTSRMGGMLGGAAGMAGGMLAGAGIAAVGAGIYGAARGVGALGSRAIETEASIAALERLDKTGRGGVQIFQEIRDQANMFGLDIDKTAHSYAGFLKLQFPDQEAKKWVSLGADMQALGNSADDVQGIFRAIGQIRSKGRLQAEEMLQLSERGVSRDLVNEEIAALMGVDKDANGAWRQAVGKLQEKGKVTWDIASLAIERALNRKLKQTKAGESAKQFAENQLKGVVNVAKTRAQDFWITLGQEAEPGLRAGLSNAITGFDKFLGTDRGQEFLTSLGDAAEWVGEKFKEIGEWAPKALSTFLEGFDSIKNSIGDGKDAGYTFKQFLDDTLPVIKNFGVAIGLVADGLERINNIVGTIRGASGAVKEATGIGLGSALSGVITSLPGGGMLGGSVGTAVALAANDNGGLVTGMSGGVATVKAAPGEGLASIGVGERIIPASGAGGGASIGNINVSIVVEGSGDPEAVAAATMAEFESKLSTVFAGAMG